MEDIYPKVRVAAVQNSPCYLDRDATVEKVCELIREAGRNNADLVAFPEVFIPGYPYWIWLDTPFKGYPFFKKLYKNAVKVPSDATDKICRAAKDANAHAVVGINEIDNVRIGTIYNSCIFVSRTGKLMGKHRKLVPTQAEKIVWGRGDGSSIKVYETDCGRLGALLCGENTNTLARFALLAQGEQLHVACYPSFPVDKGKFDMPSAIQIRAGAHAFEGKIFVVVSSSTISDEMVKILCDTDEKRSKLTASGGCLSGVYGPDGKCVVEPLIDKEGIVYADIDLEATIEPKLMHDIIGHYNRFDIFSLNLNVEPNEPIRYMDRSHGFFEPNFMESFIADLKQTVRNVLNYELRNLAERAIAEAPELKLKDK